MTEDEITWHFNERDETTYLKRKIITGNFTFHSYDYFDEEKFKKDEQDAHKQGKILPNPSLSLLVSWKISSDDASALRSKSKKEMSSILSLLTLQTNFIFELGQFDHRPGDSRTSSHHNDVMLQPPYQELPEDAIKKAMDLKNKIDSMNGTQKDLIIRTIDWYYRGMKEYDLVNSFANFWIGFESLSYWFGNGPAWNCSKCGTRLHPSSIRGRMREFLQKVGLSNEEGMVLELYDIRNNLFHNAKSFDPRMKSNLRDLLKKCILSCLS